MCKAIALLFPILLLTGLISVAHSGFYRWVDEEGNVQYSDTLPPEQIQGSHEEIGKGGITIKEVPPAKTPEEIRKEQELKRLRAEQQRLLREQREADRVLLRLFRSEDDIYMARNGKIAAINVMIDFTKNNILRQQEKLARLLTKAADLERAGKPLPQHRIDAIEQVVQTVRTAYAAIIDREKEKEAIRARFDKNLARFRELKKLPEKQPPIHTSEQRPILHNLVPCATKEKCDRLWGKATAYVRQHATTPVQTSSDVIFISAAPASAQDVSLILSRIADKEGPGASLFLDLQCHRSVAGKEFCRGDLAQGIVQGFRTALIGEDAPQP
jgi:hypothetical protein